MKIICTKEEFAALVKSCMGGQIYDNCRGCIMGALCSQGEINDDIPMSEIEDVCEVVSDG